MGIVCLYIAFLKTFDIDLNDASCFILLTSFSPSSAELPIWMIKVVLYTGGGGEIG